MKKGISLIVLVITIIVMIIIAGAIIISLNSSNVISQANKAVTDSDLANAKNTCMLAYCEAAAGNDGIAKDSSGAIVTASYYEAKLTAAGFKTADYTVTVNAENGIPSVTAKTTATH